MRRATPLAAAGLLLAACATSGGRAAAPTPVPAAAPAPPAAPPLEAAFLVRQPAFEACELEAFMALTIARNLTLFKDTREKLLALPSNRSLQIAMITEVADRLDRGEKVQHGFYATERLRGCVARERVALRWEGDAATICLLRTDLVFFLFASKGQQKTEAEALAHVKRLYAKASRDVYPEPLMEQLAPLVYRASDPDAHFELRRFVFETCLVPDEWKAWWSGTSAAREAAAR